MKKIDVKNVSKKGLGFFGEFKEFIARGNVMDMAVGVIIGAAFGSIVTSLTDNFIKPLINSIGGAEVAGSIKLPWVDYSGLDTEAAAALSLNYGAFISAVINFLIIAFILFLMIKGMNKLMSIGKKKKEEEAGPAPKSDEVVLLEEIRDLLKKQK